MFKFVYLGIMLLLASSCRDEKLPLVALPASPGGNFKPAVEVLEEGAVIRIADAHGKAPKYDMLKLGQCNGASFYWRSENEAVLEYDDIEITYFSTTPYSHSGASIYLCDRQSRICGSAVGSKSEIPGCDDTM